MAQLQFIADDNPRKKTVAVAAKKTHNVNSGGDKRMARRKKAKAKKHAKKRAKPAPKKKKSKVKARAPKRKVMKRRKRKNPVTLTVSQARPRGITSTKKPKFVKVGTYRAVTDRDVSAVQKEVAKFRAAGSMAKSKKAKAIHARLLSGLEAKGAKVANRRDSDAALVADLKGQGMKVKAGRWKKYSPMDVKPRRKSKAQRAKAAVKKAKTRVASKMNKAFRSVKPKDLNLAFPKKGTAMAKKYKKGKKKYSTMLARVNPSMALEAVTAGHNMAEVMAVALGAVAALTPQLLAAIPVAAVSDPIKKVNAKLSSLPVIGKVLGPQAPAAILLPLLHLAGSQASKRGMKFGSKLESFAKGGYAAVAALVLMRVISQFAKINPGLSGIVTSEMMNGVDFGQEVDFGETIEVGAEESAQFDTEDAVQVGENADFGGIVTSEMSGIIASPRNQLGYTQADLELEDEPISIGETVQVGETISIG